MSGDHVTVRVALPGGELRLLQPRESAALPDDGAVEWAPIAPYWSVLWRSGVALAASLDQGSLHGARVVELGCGLGVPSLVAARAGATVLATDGDAEARPLVEQNAALNGVGLETATVEWSDPGDLAERGPFDLVLAADVLYERSAVAQLLRLLPLLSAKALIADPGRPAAGAFLAAATPVWSVETRPGSPVDVHRLSRAG